jgi:translation machinery-associated protein 16
MKEFDLGFWLPDLTDKETLRMLPEWSGEWVGLNNLKFERIKKNGERKMSIFPPKGNS